MQIKQKSSEKTMKVIQSINVSATLRAMEVGSEVIFDSVVNETTLRNACVRLKGASVGAWSVDKMGSKGFRVTRTA